MASSAVSICSNALLMNGALTISSFTDNTPRATQCANLYPLVRDYVLSSHPWNCCIKRVQLNPDSETPGFDWAFQFTLPPDFLRLQSFGEAGFEDEYRIEGGKLLSDAPLCKLRYVYKNEDENTWTPLLVMAMTLAMRQVLAYPITQSTSLEQLIDQAIEPTLRRARSIDSQDQPPEMLGDHRLLSARFGARGG